MVYRMDFYVDGGCRGNGQPGAIGAAACCLMNRFGDCECYQARELPRYPVPTNQRAEIRAIIMALKWALERYDELNGCPRMDVRIHSDSRYAVDCMSNWIYKWTRNGWTNSSGNEVANRDLLEKASHLDDRVTDLGSVNYIWIPREQNQDADRICNEALDEQE
ncbi:ribonuclease H-like domain-containing protein [Xylariaceae sp. FL0662B]|nr:ribonuclease H-like domain-containing protein [Xylariaceae sp. FL0662B]